jgi:hypothetical protein
LTIFGEKIGVFSKANVMIKFLHNLALFPVKNAKFVAEFFGENIFKIITSVPGNARPKKCFAKEVGLVCVAIANVFAKNRQCFREKSPMFSRKILKKSLTKGQKSFAT